MSRLETNRSVDRSTGREPPLFSSGNGGSVRGGASHEAELERALAQKEKELEALQKIHNSVSVELLDTNKAISVLVKKYERISQSKEREIARRIEQDILPMVTALKDAPLSPDSIAVDLEMMTVRIKALIRELNHGEDGINQLTPAELRVALMIRDGATSVEIADSLYVSESTVKTHRKSIRSKLSLQKRKVNLANYLKELL